MKEKVFTKPFPIKGEKYEKTNGGGDGDFRNFVTG